MQHYCHPTRLTEPEPLFRSVEENIQLDGFDPLSFCPKNQRLGNKIMHNKSCFLTTEEKKHPEKLQVLTGGERKKYVLGNIEINRVLFFCKASIQCLK
ncbi:hypothetical protein JD844_018010 [Phrynosoma platyrhinos]|uniref:Uncharacterized protein n=1 Tax=Phrynosoma platyrhinos TaxID=52577 RepID=A0ABQ7SMT2_PHRPL|nr:hypothetical protein JD844_018010 [Phrynosoma platyrhinos]